MKVFPMLVVVAVLSAQIVVAQKDNVTMQMKEKRDPKEKKSNTGLSTDTSNKTQQDQLSHGVNKPSNVSSNTSSNITASTPPTNIHQGKSKKDSDTTQIKEKQNTKVKNGNTSSPPINIQQSKAKKDNTTQTKEKQTTKDKNSNTPSAMGTPNKTQAAQLPKPANKPSNISSNVKVPPPSNTEQMKGKEDTKDKNGTANKTQEAQLSAGVNKPSNKPSNIASNVKVPPPSNKQQSSFKLPDGIRIPAGIPTGIPADIVGKATKKLKNHFKKSWNSTPKSINWKII